MRDGRGIAAASPRVMAGLDWATPPTLAASADSAQRDPPKPLAKAGLRALKELPPFGDKASYVSSFGSEGNRDTISE